jgi:hypothetical protein
MVRTLSVVAALIVLAASSLPLTATEKDGAASGSTNNRASANSAAEGVNQPPPPAGQVPMRHRANRNRNEQRGKSHAEPKTTSPLVITDINVLRNGGEVEIEITGSGPMRARTMRLPAPERFVVDIEDATFAGKNRTLKVDAGVVKSVRVGTQYRDDEQVTRVVVDLESPRAVVVARAQNKLSLKIAGNVAEKEAEVNTPAASDRLEKVMTSGQNVSQERSNNPPRAEEKLAEKQPGPVANTPAPASSEPLTPAKSAPSRVAQTAEKAVELKNPAWDGEKQQPAMERAVSKGASGPLEPTLAAQDSPPPIAANGMGVGITGRATDELLGSDPEEGKAKGRSNSRAFQKTTDSQNREQSATPPLRLSGSATAGFYEASTRSGSVSTQSSPVGSLSLDASGYYHSPDFLSYNVKPRGSVGLQTSEAVFPDGRGIFATTTFLAGGVAPFTVSYSQLSRKLVNFGPLDRLAGLEANTSQESLGANWKIRLKNLPDIRLNFSRYSDRYEPTANLAPRTTNASQVLAADLSQKVMGWNLQWHNKLEHSAQDLVNIFDPTQLPYQYKHNKRDMRASADRDFGEWLSLSWMGGNTKSKNELQGRPFDQSFRYLNSNSVVRSGKKWTLAFRAGITDNIIGATLESADGGAQLLSNQPIVLTPTTAKLRLVNYSGSAHYGITNDLRVSTDLMRETAHAPQSSGGTTPDSTLDSLQAGISYLHRFRWWQLQSSYAANGGRFNYQSTGNSNSYGQRASLGVAAGSLQSLEVSASLQGSLQNVSGNTFMRDRGWGATFSVSRSLFEHWKVRATYNRERDHYRYLTTELASDGNAVTVALVTPRAEVSAAHNVRDGLTFQADPRLQYVSSSQGSLLLGAFPGTLIVPSGATWDNAAFTFHPTAKFRARAAWLRNRQRLQGATSNSYTEWEASGGYQFRSISVDLGYVLHNQSFGADLFRQNRFFFRIVREFTIF